MTISAVHRAAALIAELEHEARTNVGVETYVPLLSQLLETIESAPEDRDEFVALLLRMVQEWPCGAIEILAFTMSTLRWPEIRAALESAQPRTLTLSSAGSLNTPLRPSRTTARMETSTASTAGVEAIK